MFNLHLVPGLISGCVRQHPAGERLLLEGLQLIYTYWMLDVWFLQLGLVIHRKV